MSNLKFYPMHREQKKAHESGQRMKGIKSNTLGNLSLGDDDARFKALELRIKSLLEKYKGDNATREKILGELDVFRVNITLAKNFGDKKAIQQLIREYHNFLNQLEK